MRIHDSVFGALLLAGALALFLYARSLPGLTGQDYGPELFPMLLAIGFAGCGLVLLVSGPADGAPNLMNLQQILTGMVTTSVEPTPCNGACG